MRLQELMDEKNQEKLRDLMGELIIKHNLTLQALAREAGISYRALWSFYSANKKGGPKTLIGVAHVLDKYGYKL